MAVNILKLNATRPIIEENLTMQEVFRGWSSQITVEVNGMSLIFGVGSTEDVVNASKGREYMDETGTPGNIKYIKKFSDIAGDQKKGWILI